MSWDYHRKTDDRGASLLKNTVEQAFAEKLRSLLIFGTNSRRYKDVFDMYYLKDVVDCKKVQKAINILIFNDSEMRENTPEQLVGRIASTFKDSQYLERASNSKQRWLDDNIEVITNGILSFLKTLFESC